MKVGKRVSNLLENITNSWISSNQSFLWRNKAIVILQPRAPAVVQLLSYPKPLFLHLSMNVDVATIQMRHKIKNYPILALMHIRYSNLGYLLLPHSRYSNIQKVKLPSLIVRFSKR